MKMEGNGMVLRVQNLAEAGVAEVPPQYIQSIENQPTNNHHPYGANINTTLHSVPVIDLFEFHAVHRNSVREAVGQACSEWGAFQVTNHGVPVQLLDDMRSIGHSFFNHCSFEEKLKYACDPSSAATQGYGSKMLVDGSSNAVLDWRDYFDHHTLPISRRDHSRWPENPTNYREVVCKYSDEMKVLAEKLLGLISESLGLESGRIAEAIGDFYQNITVSYYPVCPQPQLTLGLQSHSDFGAITLLIQDQVEGLQLFKDSQWITVPPLLHSIVVLLADQTEIITNGIYKSAQHRAITNSSRARLSVATFHDPAKTAKLSPAFELIGDLSPLRYGDINYGDYVSSWYKGPEGKRNIDAHLINY